MTFLDPPILPIFELISPHPEFPSVVTIELFYILPDSSTK